MLSIITLSTVLLDQSQNFLPDTTPNLSVPGVGLQDSITLRPEAEGYYNSDFGMPEDQGWNYVDHDPSTPKPSLIWTTATTGVLNFPAGSPQTMNSAGTLPIHDTNTRFYSRLGQTFRFSDGFTMMLIMEGAPNSIGQYGSFYIAAVDSDSRSFAVEVQKDQMRIIYNTTTGASDSFALPVNPTKMYRVQVNNNSIRVNAIHNGAFQGVFSSNFGPAPLGFQMLSRVWFGDGATNTAFLGNNSITHFSYRSQKLVP